MQPIKMFGIAALAALLAMAFVGVSSAVAEPTVLCSNDVTVEEKGEVQEEGKENKCEEVTHIHETSVGKAKLKSSLPTIECNALFLGDRVKETYAPLVIEGAFTYSSCNNFCSVKEENGPAEIKVLREGEELSSVTGEGLVHVSCPFINCNYIGEGLQGHGKGPLTATQKNGEVVITEQATQKESGSCPEEAFLTITTTPLSATYVPRWPRVCIAADHGKSLFKDSECEEHDLLVESPYELGWALPGTRVPINAMVCAYVGANRGLYLAESTRRLCASLVKTRTGSWELGFVVGYH